MASRPTRLSCQCAPPRLRIRTLRRITEMALADTLEQIKNFDLSDIDLNRMGVWPLPGKIFVCVLVAALVLGAVGYLKIKDLNQQLDRVTAQETTLRQNFERKSFQAANLDEYLLQMEEMERSFGALLDRLPGDTEVPGLLVDIDSWGFESGMDINSLRILGRESSRYGVMN